MELGKKIYQLRRLSGMTQEQLAEKLNISRQTLSKWENGTGMPDVESVVRLSVLFHTSLEELLLEEENHVEEKNCEELKSTQITLEDLMRINAHNRKMNLLFCSGFLFLAIGIILSMFTALFVTRFVLRALYYLGFDNAKMYGLKKEKAPINFLGKRNICFIISLAVIAAGFVGMGMNKASIGDMFNYSLDFKGGTSTNVTFNEDMTLERISTDVVPVVESITKDASTQTQKVAGTN